MKGCAALLCFLASISIGEGRLIGRNVMEEEYSQMFFNRSLANRTLAGENRTLLDEFERSLFNRSLEMDNMHFNRSLFNRSLESRRLLEESVSESMPVRGLYNRSLEANEYEQ